MQEYYEVTRLNCEAAKYIDFYIWVDGGGFWSKLLTREENITIKNICADYVEGVQY